LNIFLCRGVLRHFAGASAFVLLCFLLILTPCKTVWADTPQKVLDAKGAVVLVRSYDMDTGGGMECAGFFIGKDGDMVDHVITAASVADYNPDNIQVFVDGQGIAASIDDLKSPGAFYRILRLDTAVKRKALSLRPMFSQGEQPQSVDGIDVYAIGFGSGTNNDIEPDSAPLNSDNLSVTSGAVSRLDTGKDMVYLHSAPCNPMFMGGPLLDKDGYVIGVNQGTGSQANGYKALAIDTAVKQLQLLNTITYESYSKKASSAAKVTSGASESATESSGDTTAATTTSSIVEADDPWYVTTFNNYKTQIIIVGAGATLIIILLAYYMYGAKKARQQAKKEPQARRQPPAPPRPARPASDKIGSSGETFVISDAVQPAQPARPAPAQPSRGLTLTLMGVTGYYANQSIPLRQSERLVIGRDDKSCNLAYPKDYAVISGIHCKITFSREKNRFVLEDEGSTNGTYLGGGRKLKPLEEVPLENGAEFCLASEDNKFVVQIGTDPGI